MSLISNNIRHLRKALGYTQASFAEALGIKRSLLGAYEEARAEPRLAYLKAMARFFGVTVDSLIDEDLTGIQQVQPGEQPHVNGQGLRVLSVTVDEKGEEDSIEMVPEKAAAGYLDGFADPEFIEELPRFKIPMLKGGTFRAFEISGDSMLPIAPGTIVIGQYVENWYNMKDRNPYILVTRSEGIVFKRVFNKLRDEGTLTLKSDNTTYSPYDISLEDVIEIWEAKMYLGAQFPEVENLSMQQLTRIVMELQQEILTLKEGNTSNA